MSLKQFNLSDDIIEFLENKKFKDFTIVQKKVIPELLKNKSILAESPTGTGKTYSFVLPIIEKININEGIQSIIFTPTKELASQIYNVIRELKEVKDFTVKKFDSSDDINRQLKHLNNNPNIIVATPDRFEKLVSLTKVNLNLKYLIVDESDMMLDFGFLFVVKKIIDTYSKNNFTWGLFSATLPLELQNFIKNNLNISDVKNINITNANEDVIINLVKIHDGNRDKTFIDLIKSEKINPYFSIIFGNTKNEVEHIFNLMKNNNIKNVMQFTSDLTSRERKRVMKAIENEEVIYLVTTDLMARGMDFKVVSHVINYSLPKDLTFYKHRIGRTNRNSIKGEIFDIYSIEQKEKYDIIRKKNNFMKFNFWKN